MKFFLFLILVYTFLTMGCAHSLNSNSSTLSPSLSTSTPPAVVTDASNSGEVNLPPREKEIKSESKSSDDENFNEDEAAGEKAQIADPIEPLNRAMYHFNDKLYFWALKPVAQGYNMVVPEVARISVKNFFSNLRFPARFVSCLLQADFSGAATEFGRFTINTVWGIGGLLDPSSNKELDLQKQDTDLGQTLGVYGVGQGFYIVWPILGPSSPRDSVDVVGDYFLYPVSYINPWYVWLGVRGYEEVNDTSLRIGDYESLKDAAIDPYIALRDAYVQYRLKKVEQRRLKLTPSKPEEKSSLSDDSVLQKN
jgi:phospholipid-binding lipoprotein MlaA